MSALGRWAAALAVVLACGGCSRSPRFYAPGQVTVKAVVSTSSTAIRLTFEVPPESMYWCEEVLVEQVSDRINLRFVRGKNAQKYAQTVDVDNPSALPVFITDGSSSLPVSTAVAPPGK